MKKGRFESSASAKKHTKKVVALLLVMLLLVGSVIGATLAWLTAETPAITNTFTVGAISLTLAETSPNSFKLIPGAEYTKDPTVSVAANSENCYVFVRVEATNVTDVIEYSIDSRWEALSAQNATGVYALKNMVATSEDSTQSFPVLAGNTVTIADGVTLTTPEATLEFTAYAVQAAGFDDAADAWEATFGANP